MQPASPCRPRPRPSRLGRLLAVAAAGVLAVTACSSTDAPSTGAPASSGATDGFPVSVEHTYGATEIPDAPQRIVTVGLSDQDAVLALGIQPVGVVD